MAIHRFCLDFVSVFFESLILAWVLFVCSLNFAWVLFGYSVAWILFGHCLCGSIIRSFI